MKKRTYGGHTLDEIETGLADTAEIDALRALTARVKELEHALEGMLAYDIDKDAAFYLIGSADYEEAFTVLNAAAEPDSSRS